MKLLFGVFILSLLLTSCMNNYYNKFGGYPLSSETFTVESDSAQFELLVTYRYFIENDNPNSTTMNVSVKPLMEKKSLPGLNIDRIAISSKDDSYLMTYSKPSIFDRKSKSPILTGNSEQPSLFTLKRDIRDYIATVHYQMQTQDSIWLKKQQSFPLDLTIPSMKIQSKREE